MFGGAYICWEICIKKSIRLAYSWKANKEIMCCHTFFALLLLLFFFLYKPPGAYIRRVDLTEAFCVTSLGG